MSILTTVKMVLKDLYRHRYTYTLRATILQLVVTLAGPLVLSLLFRALLISSDLPGITTDNLASFLTNPLTLLVLLVYLFALAFLVYFEFSLLVEMIRHKEARLSLTIRRLKQDTFDFFKSVSGWHVFAFLLYLVMTLPFLQFLFSSALLENLYIPKFLSGELMKSNQGKILYYSLYAVLAYINLRFIYTLPMTVTGQGQRFGKSMMDSWRETKGKKIFKLIGLVLTLVILLFILSILSGIGIELASLLDSNSNDVLIETLFLSFTWGVTFAGSLFFKLASLSYLLTVLGRNKAEQLTEVSRERTKRRGWALLGLLLIIGGVSFFYNSTQISSQDSQNIQILAHRGDVNKGVENSIEAMEAAAKEGANYVEMDIILSKDGQFIVSHDNNLKRLTGKDISISESNASDVIGLTISQNGHKSQLVSFDTYVAKAKELGIKLLVELKPTGSEPANYEQLFVDKMKELGVSTDYLAMSLNLETIEKVEELDSEIQTGYTISLQIGDFTTKKVDFYAIEDFSYNELLANHAHKLGKKIYVWTINSTSDIDKYLQTSVDGVITDYPELVKQEKENLAKDNSYLSYFLRLMN
ncbi:glycerophosphoryl diester phosphodiesterase membrane domain-containing protein [Streptococcus loxodontisalivarius]|uniref:Glycerophosphoryl diester phosphodiesterase n=1 Tax=Streptococcus loxodontisalivarius TaxID=1349415 RepID=A0ABS2PQ01_9STRE|nr:glycerophosphodiester phosphodiesterase [Streptococcus loxodontisalivarius]MBM7642121.1 glycerophosphoryl diester phosphodiesterase [Streptococcus loxodontisalivarius]